MNKKWMHLLSLPCVAALLTGCTLLEGPEPEPTPTPAPTPGPTVFEPNDGIVHGIKLNEAGNPKLPDAFQVAEVLTPELLAVRSVKNGVVTAGPPEVMRVAGIVAPLPGQPGFDQALLTTVNWTQGEVSIEQDPKFPRDLENRRYVQVFFKGTGGATKGVDLSLNRMLVRSGYAVVDMHSPSTFTAFPAGGWTWYNDEQYARQHLLGLWGRGIILGQRLPPEPSSVPDNTDANARGVTVQPDAAPAADAAPGEPPAPEAPPAP